MQSRPSSQRPRLILSFDFDGTLHDPASKPPVPSEFFVRMAQLRGRLGASWGINTGRSLEHLLEGLADCGLTIGPDWVVAREREIYLQGKGGLQAHQAWNQRCESEIAALFEIHRDLLASIRREVEERTGAQWFEMEGEPAGVIARTEEEIEWIVGRVLEQIEPDSDLAWQRNSIYLRFGHRAYQKGSSLSELARLHGLGPGQCFAMGDSHNDLEMLAPEHAGMCACPANALAEVKELVARSGGLITASVHGAGVLEALDHFFGGSVIG
ncbi:MAG TPA: HAD hydrolase family protein [Luteolibacter sp.]|nr:HAD hydrolase family protein [Luteolibacter sp.]